jgi:hypothetical protein
MRPGRLPGANAPREPFRSRTGRPTSTEVVVRRIPRAIVLAVGVAYAAACGGPAREPAPGFGRVTALLGAAPVVGAWGPDSVVAVYSARSGTLQIDGARLGGGAAGPLPLVRVMMSCAAAPRPGVYRVAGTQTPVHVAAYLRPRGLLAVWPHLRVAWPRLGVVWPRSDAGRALLSDSTPPGVLALDTLDLTGGRIYGRFRAAVRSYNRTPAESLAVAGTFWGRVRTLDDGAWPGGQPRWAPGFDRDCAAARRPPDAGRPTIGRRRPTTGHLGGAARPDGRG